MKYLAMLLLLLGGTLGAQAQPRAADPATDPSVASSPPTEAPPSLVLRASAQAMASDPTEAPTGLSVDDHRSGGDAPTAWEEFSAEVTTFIGPRYPDTYRVRPSSLGGWAVQILARIVCDGAADHGAAEQRCNAIGTRLYRYPRF